MTHGAAAKRAAREARSSTALRGLARGGYAANGVVHVIIGLIAIAIALGARGEGDQAGAFKTIGGAPLGFVGLWALAVLLGALGLWHAANGLIATRASDVKKWGVRISEWGQALVFLALGAIAASVALGARPNAEKTAEEASRGVLTLPGGAWLLGLVGIGIAVGGVSFLVMGVLRSFRSKVDIPEGRLGSAVTALGVGGFIAKGVALLVVGILVTVAAVTVDPGTAGGLDGAIDTLLDMFAGPFLVGLVGAGFVAYGVFCFFRARYAHL
ncbi:MAG: DUF1206 domain-containing protein [Microbacterium sp.]|nr:MAG: DUF1206 domain-containing protein [Microbacterium sp.]